MRFDIILKQCLSGLVRLSLRPWVAGVATAVLFFSYLAIFNAATVNVSADAARGGVSLQRSPPNGSASLRVASPGAAKDRHGNSSGPSAAAAAEQHQQHKHQKTAASLTAKDLAPKKSLSSSSTAASDTGGKEQDAAYASFLQKHPIINVHNYSYIHNVPDACTRRPVRLVIVSPSGPNNFYRRMMARKSARTRYTADPANAAVQLFFLGSHPDAEVQRKVAMESKRFGDIVQESFVDVYANITLKAVEMLKWVSVFCDRSQDVIRLDDDVMADMGRLLQAMAQARGRHREFILGEVKTGWVPCKIPKCRTTKEEYPYATLPPFALGGALGYPTSTVLRLYEATKRLKRFKLDDVYVTGMCAPKVGVKLLQDDKFVFQHGAW